MNELPDQAEELFKEGSYANAYEIYRQLAENNCMSDEIRSDAYLMMGVIVHIDLNADDFEDQSGLNFFMKSLEYNAYNMGALFNVIAFFGTSVDNHQNIPMLDTAISRLHAIDYQFTEYDKETIERKLKLREEMLKGII